MLQQHLLGPRQELVSHNCDSFSLTEMYILGSVDLHLVPTKIAAVTRMILDRPFIGRVVANGRFGDLKKNPWQDRK